MTSLLPLATSTIQPIVVDFAINFLGWATTIFIGSGSKYYDFTGSLAFIITNIYSHTHGSGTSLIRQRIATGMIVIWSARLGIFLFNRILKHGGIDKRVEKHVNNHQRFFTMWFLQGVWVMMNSLPILTLNAHGKTMTTPLTILDGIQIVSYLLGLTLQIIADEQKSNFNVKNKGRYITTGLWKYCQHPNYFAEFLIHSSIALFCAPALFQGTLSQKLVVFSPLFEILLIRYVSGVPILQNDGMKKWGKEPDYLLYRKNTSLLVPWPWHVTNEVVTTVSSSRLGSGGGGGGTTPSKNRSRSRSSKTATMAQRRGK